LNIDDAARHFLHLLDKCDHGVLGQILQNVLVFKPKKHRTWKATLPVRLLRESLRDDVENPEKAVRVLSGIDLL